MRLFQAILDAPTGIAKEDLLHHGHFNLSLLWLDGTPALRSEVGNQRCNRSIAPCLYPTKWIVEKVSEAKLCAGNGNAALTR